MAAVLVDVADAITTALNGGSFSESFTAVRSYAEWDEALTDVDTLRVDVVPVNYTERSQLVSRNAYEYQVETDIGVRKRFAVADQDATTGRIDTAEIDALVLLVEEINEFFIHDALGSTGTVWDAVEIRAAYVREHLRNMRQFTGIVRVTHTKDVAV